MKKTRIMFVCLGNICRSPLAEAIMRHKVESAGLQDLFEIDSSGTASYHVGEDPDVRTLNVARKYGVPMKHKGRQFNISDFDNYDLILAMDTSNLSNINKLAKGQMGSRVELMRAFENQRSGNPMDVPDPWYGDESDFEACFSLLDECCSNLLDHLLKE